MEGEENGLIFRLYLLNSYCIKMGGFYHNKKNRSEFATKFKQFSLNYQFKNFVKEKYFVI